ncbi:MAG: LemA family protein [Oscillatoria sp. SIO1A7]|nr:LemA family protein [Oscillatoria sp. SIO1A7]
MDLIVFLLIIGAVFGFLVSKIYNSLNSLEGRVKRNLSGVDVVLEERHNTIKKLKAVVTQEKKNLREQFERLADLIEHSGASKGNPKEYFETENKISLIWTQTLELPEIQQVKGFEKLSDSIIDIEQEISAARRTYNASVERFNNELGSFPSGFVAQLLFKRFESKEFFKATEQTRKDVDLENWS